MREVLLGFAGAGIWQLLWFYLYSRERRRSPDASLFALDRGHDSEDSHG